MLLFSVLLILLEERNGCLRKSFGDTEKLAKLLLHLESNDKQAYKFVKSPSA
jgi:hypothetical protein